MLVLVGSEVEVGEYEQAITLVGTAWKLPEKFRLADTIGRKPRCEVGVFIFGQPGFHNIPGIQERRLRRSLI